VLANASFQGSEGEIGSLVQGRLSDGVSGENMENARVDVGVVGNLLQGVVGAEESSSFRLEVIGTRCRREELMPAPASGRSLDVD
jgi:hypothetical protein